MSLKEGTPIHYLTEGAGSTTIWSTESIGLGHVELSYWPMNGVPAP